MFCGISVCLAFTRLLDLVHSKFDNLVGQGFTLSIESTASFASHWFLGTRRNAPWVCLLHLSDRQVPVTEEP